MKRKDLPALTALRFPAAFAIVLFHFLTLWPRFPAWSVENLSLGVSFFYVLSGFILYYTYSDLKSRTAFWVARVARIWPVHLVTCALIFFCLPFVYILGHASWHYTLPLNLLLLQAWVPTKGSVLSFNGVSWSLSVEAFFYFSFPWLLFSLKKWGNWPLLLGTYALGFVAVLTARFLIPSQEDFGSYFPACRIFEFALGMITCKVWIEQSNSTDNHRHWTFLEAGSLAISVLFVLVIAPLLKRHVGFSPVVGWMMTLFPALCFAAVIWIFAHQAGFFARVLSSRLLVQWGEVSFSLYMCHQIVLRFLQIQTPAASAPWEILFGLYLLISMALAYLLFYLVETPARHLIVNFYRRSSGAKPGRSQ